MANKVQTKYGLMILFLVFVLGCKKEFTNTKVNENLIFNPFGKDVNLYQATPVQGESFFALKNANRLMKIQSQNHQVIWDTAFDQYASKLISCNDQSVLIIGNSYYNWEYQSITRMSKEGKQVYVTSPGQKMLYEFPNHREYLADACSDGNNGAYLLIVMNEMGKYPEDIKGSEVYLLHFNAFNKVDQKICMNGHYLRLASDAGGELFATRFISSLKSYDGEDDTLEVCKFNKNDLKNNQLNKTWTAQFFQKDYYKYNYIDMDLNLLVNGSQVFSVNALTRLVNIEYGIVINQYEKETGTRVSRHQFDDLPPIDSYVQEALLISEADASGAYITGKFAAVTKLYHISPSGALEYIIDLKGNRNRSEVTAIQCNDNLVKIFGRTTKGNTINYQPFLYLLHK